VIEGQFADPRRIVAAIGYASEPFFEGHCKTASNGLAIDTRTSSLLLFRPGSLPGEPIMKLPAGTTTISGQV
jgi:hypothetical protein